MRVVITGGGTGGHTSAGLAVAAALRARGDHVARMGRQSGGHQGTARSARGPALPPDHCGQAPPLLGLAERAGPGLARAGRDRAGVAPAAPAPALAPLGHRRVRGPAPPALAARALGIPVVVHQQTSVPGRANRIAGRFARRIAITFPVTGGDFPERVTLTGNPLRPELAGGPHPTRLASASVSTPGSPSCTSRAEPRARTCDQPDRGPRPRRAARARSGHPPVGRQPARPATAPWLCRARPRRCRRRAARATPSPRTSARSSATSMRRRTWSSGAAGRAR